MIIGQITINSNGDELTFTPASFRVSYESIAGANSGRTDDGTMKINWKARRIVKLEIGLPPYSLDDPDYYAILSMIQGQEYQVYYFDPMSKSWKTELFYTSNTNGDFYSGIILNGIIQGCSFNAIGMNSYYKVDSTHPTAPLIPHITPAPVTQLDTPVISINNSTVSWTAIQNANSYVIYDNGTQYSQVGTGYIISNTSINHSIRVKAVGSGYTDSEWSNTVTYVPSGVEYWTIHWNDGISVSHESDDPDDPDPNWSVEDQTLTVPFTSNNRSFSSMGPVDANEAFAYDGNSVYEGSGDVRGWNYVNINYQDIIMYDDPDSYFTGDWEYFLQYNGTVTHYNS